MPNDFPFPFEIPSEEAPAPGGQALAAIAIPFLRVHPRVGYRLLSVEPGNYPIHPSPDFAAPSIRTCYWPKTIGSWFYAQAESVMGITSTRFDNTPYALEKVIHDHNAYTCRWLRRRSKTKTG